MASNIDILSVRGRLGVGAWNPARAFGSDGFLLVSRDGARSVIVTCAPYGAEGTEWVHASMSSSRAMPTYEDLKALHFAVFYKGWAYQVFAPPREHVNIDQNCLHLFGRLDGAPIMPDFTLGMGSI